MKEFEIKLKVKEKKADSLQKIKFEPILIPKNPKALANSELYLKFFEQSGELKRQFMQQEDIGKLDQGVLPCYRFPMV